MYAKESKGLWIYNYINKKSPNTVDTPLSLEPVQILTYTQMMKITK